MLEPPTFEEFVQKKKFKNASIDLLPASGYDDLELIALLTPERIAELVANGLVTGKALRIQLAMDFLNEGTKAAGAQPVGTVAAGLISPENMKTEFPTTQSLSKDKEINTLVDGLLGDEGRLDVLKELLSLAEI